MGGGDLNMKKSWHPLLMKNQERVWKEERKALEERKKTAQLQKELAEERQLQELQRIQAEQGGGRREERVEWLYATPASGAAINAEEQEAYLLGKKTVDKLFREKDAAKLQARAASKADADKAGGGFISLQNANTARDTASKIREDPLLAIKQQEQLAYEKMKKNPARLKALQASLSTKEERKKEKEEKKKHRKEIKDELKRLYDSNDDHRERSREERHDIKRPRSGNRHSRESGRSPSPDGHSRTRHPRLPDHRRNSDRSSRHHRDSTSPDDNHRRRNYRQGYRSPSRTPPRAERGKLSRSHGPSTSSAHHLPDKCLGSPTQSQHRHHDNSRHRHHDSDRPQDSSSFRRSAPAPREPRPSTTSEGNDRPKDPQRISDSRAAKLAEMQAAAKALQESRSQRLQQLEAEDAERMKAEEADRERNRTKVGGVGDGIKAKFVIEQEKQVFFGQMGLAERVKRSGGVGLQKDRE